MVELIVVIVILMILAVGIVLGVGRWISWTKMKQQDEYARTLFVAAQNRLTELSGSGQLKEYETVYLDSKKSYVTAPLDVTTLTSPDGTAYDLNKLWPESNKETTKETPDKYRATIVSVRLNASDYQRYDSGEEVDEEISLLYNMLEMYLYDTSILNANICVEFTPQEGQVFSVLYSSEEWKDNGRFHYSETPVKGDIRNRTYRARKSHGYIGYYGVDTLYKSTGYSSEKPTIRDLELHNEETLNLTFGLSRVQEAILELRYEITIYDQKTQKALLQFTINGGETDENGVRINKIKNSSPSALDFSNILCDVTRFTYEGENRTEENLGRYPFACWYDETEQKIHLILDAADFGADSIKLYEAYAGLKNVTAATGAGVTTDTTGPETESVKAIKNTFSFHRFGVQAENIYCTVGGNGDFYKPTVRKQSNSEHAYFESGAEETEAESGEGSGASNYSEETVVTAGTETQPSKMTYGIANGRHLYNMRYLEDQQSDLSEHTDETTESFKWKDFQVADSITYEVTRNFSWTDLFTKQALFQNGKLVTDGSGSTPDISDWKKADSDLEFAAFPSIRQLRSTSTFRSHKAGDTAENFVISELWISEGKNQAYYGESTGNTKTRSTETENEDRKTGTGLFLENKGLIQNLSLDKIVVEGTDYVGAFCGKNEHDLTNLVLLSTDDQSSVTGEKYVGGIAGGRESKASEADTEKFDMTFSKLKNYAVISGKAFVGGITGSLEAAGKETIRVQSCENYGRIVGLDTADKDENGNQKGQAVCLGGIAGYLHQEKSDPESTGVGIKLQSCISIPQYKGLEEELEKLEKDTGLTIEQRAEKLRKLVEPYLKGIYVGGIAGYNDGASIEGCNTAVTGNLQGYVTGSKYVGGIVGFSVNASELDGTLLDENYSKLSTGNTKGNNDANVIGHSYVGGIVGCNAETTSSYIMTKEKLLEILEDASKIVTPEDTAKMNNTSFEKTSEKVIVKNWENKGSIVATWDYVGGITGYNAAKLEDCSCDVSKNSTIANLVQSTCLYGDYVGGIAGYNNGFIGTSADNTSIQIVCDVYGKNYVGGVVGFNDQEGKIEHYSVSGGYIRGTGCFVGGYIGVNTSENLFQGGNIFDSNPNEVSGAYCVGGIFGGNILAMTEDKSASFVTNNFLGTVKAEKAVVGGFIGYNRVIDVSGTNATLKTKLSANGTGIRTKLGELCETLNGFTTDTNKTDYEKAIAYLNYETRNDGERVDWLLGTTIPSDESENSASVTFTITGEKENQDTTSKLSTISAQVYAGGVIGYNDEASSVCISNVKNVSRISAEQAIMKAEERPDEGSDTDHVKQGGYQYSYAGGITGKVTKNMMIENCRNEGDGEVFASGTYLGGLCEVNEGTMKDCTVASIGGVDRAYVGGIAGLNKGKIQDCGFASGAAVAGTSYVGGFAAENFGTILLKNDAGMAQITATGDNAGGVCGYNAAAGRIYGSQTGTENGTTGSQVIFDVTLTSDGKNAGGIAGCNKGSIQAQAPTADGTFTIAESGSSEPPVLIVTGQIQGRETVGGICGEHKATEDKATEDKVLSYLVNKAVIIAEQGNAGGIAGTSTAKIAHCENKGEISAAKSGNAGGIVAENEKEISYCTDTGVVAAANGICGGIAAINKENAAIVSCTVQSGDTDSSKYLELEGKEKIGGVCGENAGTITEATVTSVSVSNTGASGDGSAVGLVTGTNTGTIQWNSQRNNDQPAVKGKVYSKVNKANLGGVAGSNAGTIQGYEMNKTAVTIDEMKFSDDSVLYANMGGIAGTSTGTISNFAVTAEITGNMGDTSYGYGGIVGVNNGTLTNLSFDGALLANGTSNAIVNMGGITGINQASGTITKSYIGTKKATTISSGNTNGTAAMGYVGGLAGMNYGSITDCNNKTDSTQRVTITNYAGHTGGIAGYNLEGAKITGTKGNILSTGASWSVTAKTYSNDAGTGGIIGYNASGASMEYIKNYANVTAEKTSDNVTCGGLVGRMENKSVKNVTIKYCENNGTISGVLSGGLIGRLKYNGVHFQSCNNYGTINITNGSGKTGGLVASIYNAMTDTIFESCGNFGNLTGSAAIAAGGICGNAEEEGKKLSFINCVNEGSVDITTCRNIGGILGDKGFSTLSFYQCQNYGNSKNIDFYGITNNANVTIESCFSVGNQIKLSPAGTGDTSYYYLKHEEGEEEPEKDPTIYLKTVKVNGSSNSLALNTLSSGLATRWAQENVSTVEFEFEQQAGTYNLKHFGVYFAGNQESQDRIYTFQVTGKYKNQVFYLSKDGKWESASNNAGTFTAIGRAEKNTPKYYWGTTLEGKPISSIQLSIKTIKNVTVKNDNSYSEGDNSIYTCLYGVYASETEKEAFDTRAQYEESCQALECAKQEKAEAEQKQSEAEQKQTEAESELAAAQQEQAEAQKKLDDLENTCVNDKLKIDTKNNTGIFTIGPTNTDKLGINNYTDLKRITWGNDTGNGKGTLTLVPKSGENIPLSKFGIKWAWNTDGDTGGTVRYYNYKVTVFYQDNTKTENIVTDAVGQGRTQSTFSYIDNLEKKNITKITIEETECPYNYGTNGDKQYRKYICMWAIDAQQPIDATDEEKAEKQEALETAKQKVSDAEGKVEAAKAAVEREKKEVAAKEEAIKNAEAERNKTLVSSLQNHATEFLSEYVAAGSSDPTTAISSGGSALVSRYVKGENGSSGQYQLSIQDAISSNPILSAAISPQAGWNDMTNNFVKADSEGTKGERQKVYEEYYPKWLEYCKEIKTGAAEIQELKISNAGNVLSITWSHKNKDYYADQLVYFVVDSDGKVIAKSEAAQEESGTETEEQDSKNETEDTVTLEEKEAEAVMIPLGMESYTLDVPDTWVGCTIYAYVRSVSGTHVIPKKTEKEEWISAAGLTVTTGDWKLTDAQEIGGTTNSKWVEYTNNDQNGFEIQASLPTPKVHYELDAYGGDNKQENDTYVAVLENWQDYEEYPDAIITFSGGVSGKFKARDKRSNSCALTGKNGDNCLIKAFASCSDYANSADVFTQTATYSADKLQESDYITTTFNDFYGDRPSNLYYKLNMKDQGLTELYMNAEFLVSEYPVTDKDKLPVGVSYGTAHITLKMSEAATMNLGNLPEEFLNYGKITVRTYPWKSQAYAQWFGHVVKEGITEEQLAAYLEAVKEKEPQTKKNETSEVSDEESETSEELVDPERNGESVFFEKEGRVQITDGYVLRLNEDGTYDVIYSAILKREVDYRPQIDQKNYQMNGENKVVSETNPDDSKDIQKQPVISEENPLSEDGRTYLFTWDANTENDTSVFDQNASYEVSLYGYATSDSSESVLLDTVTITKDKKYQIWGEAEERSSCDTSEKQWSYAFLDTNDSWNYLKLKLVVTRIGTVETGNDQKGQTKIFPSAASQTFAVQKRFSQIMKPGISLQRNEDNTVNKDTLLYKVSWSQIPKSERTSGDLRQYEVTVDWNIQQDPDSTTTEYQSESELNSAWEKECKFYQEKLKASQTGNDSNEENSETELKGNSEGNTDNSSPQPQTEESEDGTTTYTYEWEETQEEVTVRWTAVLKKEIQKENSEDSSGATSSTFRLTKTLCSVWCYPYSSMTEEEKNAATLKNTLDLNEYPGNATIAVSVRAIAAENAATYRNGKEGVIRTTQLPKRLQVPPVTKLTASQTYENTAFVTQSDFRSGYQLSFTNNDATEKQGKYEIAIAVYETKPETEASFDTITNAGDVPESEDRSADYWNSGAITTIYPKAERKTMQGNLQSSVLSLGSQLSTEYAGKWMKIAMRSISDSNISSWWSDEDDASEGTVNYQWIQIPRIQVELPAFNYGSEMQYYDDNMQHVTGEYDYTNYPVQQITLNFKEQKHASAYKIIRVRMPEQEKGDLIDTENSYALAYTDILTITEKNGTDNTDTGNTDNRYFEVTMRSSDPKVETKTVKLYAQNAASTSETERNVFELNWPAQTALDVEGTQAELYSCLIWTEEDGTASFQLLLPDVLSIDSNAAETAAFTQQVTVQAVVGEEKTAYYQDSRISNWYRKADNNRTPAAYPATLSDAAAAPEVTIPAGSSDTNPIISSAIADTAFELTASNGQNYRIYELTDYEGNETILVSGYQGSGSQKILLDEKRFASWAGKMVTIRSAEIISGESGYGGLTKWSTESRITLPEKLRLKAPVLRADVANHALYFEKQENAQSYVISVIGTTSNGIRQVCQAVWTSSNTSVEYWSTDSKNAEESSVENSTETTQAAGSIFTVSVSESDPNSNELCITLPELAQVELVTVEAKSSDSDQYIDSNKAVWYRSDNAWMIGEVEEGLKAPQLASTSAAETSDRNPETTVSLTAADAQDAETQNGENKTTTEKEHSTIEENSSNEFSGELGLTSVSSGVTNGVIRITRDGTSTYFAAAISGSKMAIDRNAFEAWKEMLNSEADTASSIVSNSDATDSTDAANSTDVVESTEEAVLTASEELSTTSISISVSCAFVDVSSHRGISEFSEPKEMTISLDSQTTGTTPTSAMEWQETELETETETETERETDWIVESESETEGETAAEVETETENVVEIETETASETETETKTETASETAAETETETASETETETETETTSETAAETESESETEIETETEQITEAETIPELTIDLEPQTAAEPETELQMETVPEDSQADENLAEDEIISESEPQADSELVPEEAQEPELTEEPEADSQPKEDSEPKAEPETEAETETTAEPEMESEAAAEPESEPVTEAVPEPETETVMNLEMEMETEIESETEPETETEGLQKISLSTETRELWYDGETGSWIKEKKKAEDICLTQQLYLIETDAKADKITLVRRYLADSLSLTEIPEGECPTLDWLELERGENGTYDLYYSTTNLNLNVTPAEGYQKKQEQAEGRIYLGTLASGDSLPLPETEEISLEKDAETVLVIRPRTRLLLQESGEQVLISLLLPDVQDFSQKDTLKSFDTLSLSAGSSLTGEDGQEVRSLGMIWKRQKTAKKLTEKTAWTESLGDEEQTGKIQDFEITTTAREKMAYEIHAQAELPLLYQIQWMEKDKVYRECKLASYWDGDKNHLQTALWPLIEEDSLKKDSWIRLRAAQITQQGSLTEWSDWIVLSNLPKLSVLSTVEEEASVDEENIAGELELTLDGDNLVTEETPQTESQTSAQTEPLPEIGEEIILDAGEQPQQTPDSSGSQEVDLSGAVSPEGGEPVQEDIILIE